ncbi:MAG: zinc ribbon domain-containing protein [Nitrososphaeraceae archaeon]
MHKLQIRRRRYGQDIEIYLHSESWGNKGSWSANQVDLRKRNQNTKGRKFNRKLLGFQYYKLTQYNKYKAALAGIKQTQVSEACTSQYCSKCFQKGTRKIQGLFTCISCNVKSENADRNAAFNVAQRDLGYMSRLGYL